MIFLQKIIQLHMKIQIKWTINNSQVSINCVGAHFTITDKIICLISIICTAFIFYWVSISYNEIEMFFFTFNESMLVSNLT